MEETDMKITKELVSDSSRMLIGSLCHQGMPFCTIVLSCGNNRIVRHEEVVALGRDMLFDKRVCRCIIYTAVLTKSRQKLNS